MTKGSVIITALFLWMCFKEAVPSLCYSDNLCTSLVETNVTTRECCVDTNDGLYYETNGQCFICIVHGFQRTVYTVTEGGNVTVTFGPNVKGTTRHRRVNMPGVITSVGDEADYEPVAINLFGNSLIAFTITAKSDEITEAVENITLKYNSSIIDYINRIEVSGEFVRHTAIVSIIDVDKPAAVTFIPVNANAVRISWSVSIHHPIIIQYTVYCSTSIMRQYERIYLPEVTSADFAIDDDITLRDVYVHNFTLSYVISDDVIQEVTTATFTFDKSVFQIQFGPFYYCLDLEFKNIARTIERQLQCYIIDIIRKGCPDCYLLTQEFLRPGLFLCHDNPVLTTYRTTLVNPFPTTNSTHLVGIIQSWVSTSPSLILDGVLVRVSPTCPTSISSLDEEECEIGTRWARRSLRLSMNVL